MKQHLFFIDQHLKLFYQIFLKATSEHSLSVFIKHILRGHQKSQSTLISYYLKTCVLFLVPENFVPINFVSSSVMMCELKLRPFSYYLWTQCIHELFVLFVQLLADIEQILLQYGAVVVFVQNLLSKSHNQTKSLQILWIFLLWSS